MVGGAYENVTNKQYIKCRVLYEQSSVYIHTLNRTDIYNGTTKDKRKGRKESWKSTKEHFKGRKEEPSQEEEGILRHLYLQGIETSPSRYWYFQQSHEHHEQFCQ